MKTAKILLLFAYSLSLFYLSFIIPENTIAHPATTYRIMGLIRDNGTNLLVGGVTVNLTGDSTLTVQSLDGTYIFYVQSGKNYKVSVFKTGWIFFPDSINVQNISADVLNPDFRGTPPPKYRVMGYIKDTSNLPVLGAQVTIFGGGKDQTGVTGEDGYYEFEVEGNTGYTVLISKFGWTFSPQSINIPNLTSDITNKDFVGNPPVKYKIKGYIKQNSGLPIPEATVFITGNGMNLKTSSSIDGYYEFQVYGFGTYTLNISKAPGWTFTPASIIITNITNDVINTDIIGKEPSRFFVRGYIKDNIGKPVYNAYISITGGGSYLSSSTDKNGYYQIQAASYNSYTMTVTKTGWSFIPAFYVIPNLISDVENPAIIGNPPPKYYIRGYIKDTSGLPLADALIIIDDGTRRDTITTNGSGFYEYAGYGGNYYTVIITKPGWIFTQSNISIQNLNGNVTNPDIICNLIPKYKVYGYVKDNNSQPLQGVTVALTGGSKTVSYMTTNNGYYEFRIDDHRSYTIEITSPSWIFTPEKINITNVTGDLSNPDITCAPPPKYKISGYVKDSTGQPIAGVFIENNIGVNLVRTDNLGYYEISVYGNTSLTLMASSGIMTFVPVKINISNVKNDITNPDIIGTQFRKYAVRGNIIDNSGKPVSGVRIEIAGTGIIYGVQIIHSESTLFSNGYYEWQGYENFSYTMKIDSMPGGTFTPSIINIPKLTGDVANPDIIRKSWTQYKVSGFIKDFSNQPVQDVNVTIIGVVYGTSIKTDSKGYYEFQVYGGSPYIITPDKPEFRFNPPNIDLTVTDADITDQMFNASPTTTGSNQTTDLPRTFSLSQNYPNPFNPATNIQFSVPEATPVRLEIWNTLGQKIRTLVPDKIYSPGVYNIVWDSKDNNGILAATGMYFYKLLSKDYLQTKKMIMMR